MSTQVITIIGACGAAGEVVTRLLASNTENEINIADIHFEKAENLASQLRRGIKPIQLDVFNAEQLKNLCQVSNIIVNCAGPTVKIRDTVGKIAIQEECDYIEIGGYDYSDDKLRNEMNLHPSLSYIISAGWGPGISDYLAYYADFRANQIFDNKEEMVFLFGDRGWWSYNGLLDTIRDIKKKAARSMSVAKAGKINKSISFTKSFDLPFGLNKQRGFLTMSPDLAAFALQNMHYKSIKGYLILFGWKSYFTFMKIALLWRSDEKCIRALGGAYQREVEQKGKFGAVQVAISGWKDGKKLKLWTGIESTEGYFMTGAGCAATVLLLLKQKVRKGFGYMSESVDALEYANTLHKLGIVIQEKTEYR
jgi:saccharopine dehydrogenase (NAD+, L-lysine-forming)